MTVGELKKLLEQLPDDIEIFMRATVSGVSTFDDDGVTGAVIDGGEIDFEAGTDGEP